MKLLVGLLTASFFLTGSSFAALRALIVVGMPGNQAEADAFADLALTTQKAVIARGGTAEVIGPDGKPARDRILAALARESGLLESDEFWLILFGHCAKGRDELPAFQIKGPRLTVQDLREALEKIPAAKFFFAGTEESGGYLEALKLPKCDILTATETHGEVSAPRFPEHWVAALAQAPQDDLRMIAARAAEVLDKDFVNLGLARSENARFRDSATGKILGPPFGADEVRLAKKVVGRAGPVAASVRAEDIEIPKATGNDLFERIEASDETRAILAEAQSVPNPAGYPAMILQADTLVTVDKTGAIDEERKIRVYVDSHEALDRWANWRFSQDPPIFETRVLAARIILPDATAYVINPARLQAEASGGFNSLLFPRAEPGCVIELAVRETNRPGYQLPMFYREFLLQDSVPTARRTLTLRVPKGRDFRTFLKNVEAEPEHSETDQSRVSVWKMSDLPAYEELPDGPPHREVAAWIGVSTARSWDEFAVWYRGVSEGAFDAGPMVKAKAAEIAGRNPLRQDRIREAFEFVSALRYAAVGCGIGGLRPRTPERVLENRYGDCKDKANLLIALLREMGIHAEFALINRMDTTLKEFPGWQFNHAIAFVPAGEEQKESTWLDSTDTVTPFGAVAPGNLGREALVFGKERAEFRKVALPGDRAGRQTETWVLHEDQPGRWRGTVELGATGLREYEQRLHLKPLSPAQRRELVQRTLDERLPGGDFTITRVSNPSRLDDPFQIAANVVAVPGRAPGAGNQWWRKTVAPTRDRDLILNDGEPFVIEQRVTFECAAPVSAVPEPFSVEAAGQEFSVQYRQTGERSLERTALCAIRSPRVAQADYAAFRAALRDWNARLERFSP
jgi:hypothetical protein